MTSFAPRATRRRNATFRRGLGLGSAAAVLGLLGCGSSDPSAAPQTFELAVVDVSGARPASLRFVVTHDGETQAVTCPGPGSLGLRCSEGGLSIEAAEAPATVVVKAAGHRFAEVELGAAELSRATQRLELSPLEPAQTTDDYATALESDAGTWASLAVTSPTELGPAEAVKFFVLGFDAQPTVYFQNTRRHPLHYEFAQRALGLGQSRPEFSRRTYQGEDRTQLAGTLTRYPELGFTSRAHGGELRAPLALEFFPSDDLSPELALRAHRLIEERLRTAAFDGDEQRLVYVPAGSSHEAALRAAERRFTEQDARFAEHVEFYEGVEQQILNPGLAYGTLLRVTPEELEARVVSFRDVLLLTRLPNELPLVGGTLSEELQTPLAHVNLAARARGTPNLALPDASTDPRVAPLLGELVRFEVTNAGFSLEPAELAEAEAFWESRAGEPLEPESDLEFDELASFDELGFDDAIRVGAKAANLGELRRVLGDGAPEGFAVPFSVYHAYLRENQVEPAACDEARADCEEEGRQPALCEAVERRCLESADAGESFFELAERLIDDAELATDAPLREASLDGLAHLIQHGEVDAAFAAELDARVQAVFGDAKVRLRSSTNAEDLPGFSGAGLYESVSAEGTGARRPSRRIREVWASVWRYRAFEERALWNVDHRLIEMGVAVNRAVDDEAANGVLITQDLRNPGAGGLYVNVQQGEVEVTNPENGAVPEIFSIVPGPDGESQIVRQRFSSLSPDTPLLSDAEVERLAAAARAVHAHFAGLYQKPLASFALDLEFKFQGPERRLSIKQARPYVERAGP